MSGVPLIRIRAANAVPVDANGDYVLYWMIAARRTRDNFALDRALELAKQLNRPLVVLEALRAGYPWASDRLHRFVLQGMRDNARRFAAATVAYYPYVEPAAGAGRGLLETLAQSACAVVTDEYPCFFLPRMVSAAAERLPVRLEVVDGLGLLPLRAVDRTFVRAVDFRRALQRTLPAQLADTPRADPLRRLPLPPPAELSREVLSRWPRADLERLLRDGGLAELPIDHAVGPIDEAGGEAAALVRLRSFVGETLHRYADEHHHPDADATSQLSPYLHFGHLSAHRVLSAIAAAEGWSPDAVSRRSAGQREGWWGMSRSSEAFLDQVVTWRELSAHYCHRVEGFDRFETLPEWAKATLQNHVGDPRNHTYDRRSLEAAETHDELWNAAQRELTMTGRIHGYLRMLWGKKVLEWSETPEQALAHLISLNDKYAVDGRDPSSTSGIFWCFGRFDRPWGPERKVFGTVRYMTSDSARRKLRLTRYLERWSARQPNLF